VENHVSGMLIVLQVLQATDLSGNAADLTMYDPAAGFCDMVVFAASGVLLPAAGARRDPADVLGW